MTRELFTIKPLRKNPNKYRIIIANEYPFYNHIEVYDFMLAELHIREEELKPIFDKYNFKCFTDKETAVKIIEELEALILVKRLVG